MKKIMFMVIMLVLIIFSVSAVQFTPCENEPGHFLDEFRNGYCFSEELVIDYYTIQDQVCLLDNKGV